MYRARVLTSLVQGSLIAERHGVSPADVVALHGWARTGQDWRRTLQGLNGLAVDLPGFGQSPPPPVAWSTTDYADLVAEAVSTLPRPVLVGHSFGGRVAVRLAAKYPHLVRGLVVTGAPLIRTQPLQTPPMGWRTGKLLHRYGVLPEGVMQKLRARYGSADYRSAASKVMRDILVLAVNESYEDSIEKLSVPMTLVWGVEDTAAPIQVARELKERIPTATLVEVPGAAHLLNDRISDEIRGSIKRLIADGE